MNGTVIICGAGPVGLVTALCLGRAGVSVCVLEKRETINVASRASTFHPPTLDILDRLGLLEPVRGRARVVRGAQYRTVAGPFARFAFDTLADLTAHPYRMHVEQAEIARAALEALERLPHVRLLFGADVLSVESAGGSAAVRFRHDGREQDRTADFVLVANGAGSALREGLGIGFDGRAYPGEVLRVITRASMAEYIPGLDGVTYLFDGNRSISLLEMHDCWRVILRPADAALAETRRDRAWVEAVLRDVLPPGIDMPPVDGWDLYRASRRLAERYAVGRVVLIGDVAHVTNTRGGMNMNCGIHDGCVVANAIVRALASGDAAPVPAAAERRHRVGATLLAERTDRSVGDLSRWAARVRAIADDPWEARAFLIETSMLDMIDREDIDAL
ncbi:FAD-binding monooxygenase protein [Gluconacetobacter sacchari DSM 12717]|uniref:FAD-dependent monooxygenase n=2 Tax=Gluconacetobacter sacchari TaxID=92759 RepID=A0A7W4NQK8_9PROT|nr:NAD(P)/FAD-dependent oxidoreductase [Gluconacetobacter sacchari]MBB2159225.1 FAD-dependent monooxygenase [Gluconacetobacter sacchari]GBQ22096.1 FAD-binding monooxygenase protein [Gluconacetobacter sacchari DSM 12717]